MLQLTALVAVHVRCYVRTYPCLVLCGPAGAAEPGDDALLVGTLHQLAGGAEDPFTVIELKGRKLYPRYGKISKRMIDIWSGSQGLKNARFQSRSY